APRRRAARWRRRAGDPRHRRRPGAPRPRRRRALPGLEPEGPAGAVALGRLRARPERVRPAPRVPGARHVPRARSAHVAARGLVRPGALPQRRLHVPRRGRPAGRRAPPRGRGAPRRRARARPPRVPAGPVRGLRALAPGPSRLSPARCVLTRQRHGWRDQALRGSAPGRRSRRLVAFAHRPQGGFGMNLRNTSRRLAAVALTSAAAVALTAGPTTGAAFASERVDAGASATSAQADLFPIPSIPNIDPCKIAPEICAPAAPVGGAGGAAPADPA